jgi:hypothetical protein
MTRYLDWVEVDRRRAATGSTSRRPSAGASPTASIIEINMHDADAWDRLAKVDIGKYSMLKVAYDMGFPFSHVHREDEARRPRSAVEELRARSKNPRVPRAPDVGRAGRLALPHVHPASPRSCRTASPARPLPERATLDRRSGDPSPVTVAPSARPRPHLVVEVKREDHFDESKHPRDQHGRFISIGAHIDLGNGVTGEVLAIGGSGAVTVAKDGGGAITVRGDELRNATIAAPDAPAAPKAPVDISPKVPSKGPATPAQVRSYLRDGLPEFGQYLPWHRVDTTEPGDVSARRYAAVRQAKSEAVAEVAGRMADVPDADLLGEADAGVIKRVESGKSVYLRKPRRYLAGDKKGEPIPGDFDYMEIEKARFDSMVKEHGAPPAGVEPVEIEGFREEKRRAAVGNLVDLWATTSNSTNARALAMQEIARDIFSLEGTADWPPVGELPELRGEIDRARETHGPRIEAFLRAQYAATQERLAAAGITEVPVFRGVKTYGEAPAWIESGDVKLRPLSSFSSDRTIAALFGYDERGGHMLTGTVPAARVLSTPRTGTGALEEAEFVVLGGPASWDITSISAADLPAAQIQTRDELITAIAAADAPDRRIALAAVAGKLGLARLIPEDWQTKAAKPSHAWPDALNEDWPKALSWDVRASTGEPVESLALLSEITGESDLRTLAQSLLDGPSAGVAPAALLAEAQAAIAGEPLAREPWPQEVTGAASGGRKVIADGTLRAMGATGRQRPHLVVEEKLVHPFDPDKHPRDHHGRWAHTPGAGFAHTVERVAAADLRIGDHVVTGDKPARRVSNISHRGAAFADDPLGTTTGRTTRSRSAPRRLEPIKRPRRHRHG